MIVDMKLEQPYNVLRAQQKWRSLVRDQEISFAVLRGVEQQVGLALNLFKITCIIKEIILYCVCYVKVYAPLMTSSSTGFTGCFTGFVNWLGQPWSLG